MTISLRRLAHLLHRLDLTETSHKELGYLLGDFFFIPPPEVVSPRYNLVLLGVSNILDMLLEAFQRDNGVGITNNKKFCSVIPL